MAGHVSLKATVKQVGGVSSTYNFQILAYTETGDLLLDFTSPWFNLTPDTTLPVEIAPLADLGVVVGTKVSVVANLHRLYPTQGKIASITGTGYVPGTSTSGVIEILAAQSPAASQEADLIARGAQGLTSAHSRDRSSVGPRVFIER